MDKIFVTKSFLPPKAEYDDYIQKIFETHHLTNYGLLEAALQNKLSTYLNTKHICLTANGTLALMIALRHAGLSGKKVITTPFTYVATLSALLWEGCIPIFADIDQNTLCINPKSIKHILIKHPDAAGIVPVHVFGNACDTVGIQAICHKHNLTCIYDAAHAFGATLYNRSLMDYGDFAIGSFHATKLFHTVEGGCIISHTDQDQQNISLHHAFGHIQDDYYTLGINAKLSEIHAAMGLAILPHLPNIIAKRKKICDLYDDLLPLDILKRPHFHDDLDYNYAYYPIQFPDEASLCTVKMALEAHNIFPRRYFYPSLTTLSYLPTISKNCECPIADRTALTSLCLPLYPDLSEEKIKQITSIICAHIHT